MSLKASGPPRVPLSQISTRHEPKTHVTLTSMRPDSGQSRLQMAGRHGHGKPCRSLELRPLPASRQRQCGLCTEGLVWSWLCHPVAGKTVTMVLVPSFVKKRSKPVGPVGMKASDVPCTARGLGQGGALDGPPPSTVHERCCIHQPHSARSQRESRESPGEGV